MKMRTDIVLMYKDVHSWAGIVCGLLLFTAFFAGAVTMFEAPLERWLSPPSPVPVTALPDTPRLIEETLKVRPEAKKSFTVHLDPGLSPQRMTWLVATPGENHDHNESGGRHFASGLAGDGKLVIAELEKSETAQFIDILHQQAGLPFEHEISMAVVGIVCLLYFLALVSGLIVLLPSLVKDLFALRLGKNFKRMWLDVHNVLGVFSLPFHIVMALTSLVFAFHDQFYGAQAAVVYGKPMQQMWEKPELSPHAGMPLLPAAEIVARLSPQAPGFEPARLEYRTVKGGKLMLTVWGFDPRYGVRAPNEGLVSVDPYDGKILQTDYLPGQQDGWMSTVTAFFALHFGNYGGAPVRWSYVLLGLSGAFLFYTGNLLWLESRRRRHGGETVATRILGRLTVGWTLGTIAGVAALAAAAKALSMHHPVETGWQTPVFYGTLAAAILWALVRGEKNAGRELLWLAALAVAAIPLAGFMPPY